MSYIVYQKENLVLLEFLFKIYVMAWQYQKLVQFQGTPVMDPVSPLWTKKGTYKLCQQASPPCHQRITQVDYYLCHFRSPCTYCKCFANFLLLYLPVRWVISYLRNDEYNKEKLTDELRLRLSQIRRPQMSGFSCGSEWHDLVSPGTETSRLHDFSPRPATFSQTPCSPCEVLNHTPK